MRCSTAPNPVKVAITLEVLGLPYAVKLWQFGDSPDVVKGPALMKITPNGRVPVLEDPNTNVTAWESGAIIINYLLRTYDKQNMLGPKEASQQAHVDFGKWDVLTRLFVRAYARPGELVQPCES